MTLYDLEFEQLDVKVIFLHGELEERFIWVNPKVLLPQVWRIKFVAAEILVQSEAVS